MKKSTSLVRQVQLSVRLQRLTREIEELIPELKAALADEGTPQLIAPAARSLERAASAVTALAAQGAPGRKGSDVRSGLEGTSPLMSLLGSRVVLARSDDDSVSTPSAGAQALAILLENPKQAFEATEIAHRLGCSIPAARTTLNRLVQSGHATRPTAGRFRAKPR